MYTCKHTHTHVVFGASLFCSSIQGDLAASVCELQLFRRMVSAIAVNRPVELFLAPNPHKQSHMHTCNAMRQMTVCCAQPTRIVVAALGGNALLQRGQPLTMEAQAVQHTSREQHILPWMQPHRHRPMLGWPPRPWQRSWTTTACASRTAMVPRWDC